MSLNRYEQTLFDYLSGATDERRHWQMKTREAAQRSGQATRELERELWAYFQERSEHVPALRTLVAGGVARVSFQNLADHLLRLWGPPPKPRRAAPPLP